MPTITLPMEHGTLPMPRVCIVCGSNSCRFKKTVFQARYTTWGGLGRGGTRMLYCTVPLCREHESHFDDYNRRGLIFVGLLFGVILLGVLGAVLIHPLAIAGALLLGFLLLGGYLVMDMIAKQTLVHTTSITQDEVTLANVHRKFARAAEDAQDRPRRRNRYDDAEEADDEEADDRGSRADESWNFGKRNNHQATWIVLAVVGGIFFLVFCGIVAVMLAVAGVFATRGVQPIAGPIPPGPNNPVVPQPVALPDQAFLDELPETEARVGWGGLGKKGLLGFEFQGTPAEKNRLLFEGKSYDHALSTHPPTNGIARVKYRLEGHYRTFSGTAAMADLPEKSGFKESPTPIVFRVWADGRVLWTSPPLKQKGAKADFRVDIANARELELHATCAGQGHYTWAVWLNPHVSK